MSLPTRGNLVVETICDSIATFEDFWNPKSRANRNKNPGNIRDWGTTKKQGGYAVFVSYADGWTALRRQVTLNIERGLTIVEFFAGKPGVYAGYAPAADKNKPLIYANFVADRLRRKGWEFLLGDPLLKILNGNTETAT